MANIQAEVEKIKKQIKERNAPKPKGVPSGDRGQRYAIMARLNGGEPLCLGWSENANGGVLAQAASIHPEWSDLRIVDRDPKEQRNRVLRVVTCRKCVEQFREGHDRCQYCNNLFTVPFVVAADSAGEPIVVITCGHCKAILTSLDVHHDCAQKTEVEAAKLASVDAVADERRGNDKFVARQDKLKAAEAKVSDGGISKKTGA